MKGIKLKAGEGFDKEGNQRLCSIDKKAFVTPRQPQIAESSRKGLKQVNLLASFKKNTTPTSSTTPATSSSSSTRKGKGKENDTTSRTLGSRILNPSTSRAFPTITFSQSDSQSQSQIPTESQEMAQESQRKRKKRGIEAGPGTLAFVLERDREGSRGMEESEEEESTLKRKERKKRELSFREKSHEEEEEDEVVIVAGPPPRSTLKGKESTILIEETPEPETLDDVSPLPSFPPSHRLTRSKPSLDEITSGSGSGSTTTPKSRELVPASSPPVSHAEEEDEDDDLRDSEDEGPSLTVAGADDSGYAEMEVDVEEKMEGGNDRVILPQSLKRPLHLQKKNSDFLEESQFYPNLDDLPNDDEEMPPPMPPPPPRIAPRPVILVPETQAPSQSYFQHGYIGPEEPVYDSTQSQFEETLLPIPPPPLNPKKINKVLESAWKGHVPDPVVKPQPKQGKLDNWVGTSGRRRKADRNELTPQEEELAEEVYGMLQDIRQKNHSEGPIGPKEVEGEEKEEIEDDKMIASSQTQRDWTPLDSVAYTYREDLAMDVESQLGGPNHVEEDRDQDQGERQPSQLENDLVVPPSSQPSRHLSPTPSADEDDEESQSQSQSASQQSHVSSLRGPPSQSFLFESFPSFNDPATQRFEEVFEGVFSGDSEDEPEVQLPDGIDEEVLKKVTEYQKKVSEREERLKEKRERKEKQSEKLATVDLMMKCFPC